MTTWDGKTTQNRKSEGTEEKKHGDMDFSHKQKKKAAKKEYKGQKANQRENY